MPAAPVPHRAQRAIAHGDQIGAVGYEPFPLPLAGAPEPHAFQPQPTQVPAVPHTWGRTSVRVSGDGTERQLHSFTIQVTGGRNIPAVPVAKKGGDGKSTGIGEGHGRYVRYIFPGEMEAVVSRPETSVASDPTFQSGSEHHLVLHCLDDLQERLRTHGGVRFQIMARQQSGPDVVLAQAELPAEQLLDMAVDADTALGAGAPEPGGRDFSLDAHVSTDGAAAVGATMPSGRSAKLRLCVEYSCSALRLSQGHAAADVTTALQFPGSARLSVCVLRASGLADASAHSLRRGETPNVSVACYIYDGRAATDVVETQVVPSSTDPQFNFKESLSLAISREFLLGSARAASEIVFEARHHPQDGDSDAIVVLGTLAIPLLPLLYSSTGIDGTFELMTDDDTRSVGKLQVHLSLPGTHPPFDPTLAPLPPATLAESTDRAPSRGLAQPAFTQTPTQQQFDLGNSAFLLRSRVTINIPDARLPPSLAMPPAVAEDMLFFFRYRWYNDARWSTTAVGVLGPDRCLEFAHSRHIELDADAQFAAYVKHGTIQLQLLPVGADGDCATRTALLRLAEGMRREVAAAYGRLRQALFEDAPASGSVFNYEQLLRLLRQQGITADDAPLLELVRMADSDADGYVSAVELMAVVQCVRHLETGGGDAAEFVVAHAVVPLAQLCIPGREDGKKELRVAGGVCDLIAPYSSASPKGTVRAQAVLEIFKRAPRHAHMPHGAPASPPTTAHRGMAMDLPVTPPLSPKVPSGHSTRIALRGLEGHGAGIDVPESSKRPLVSKLDSNLLVTSSDYGVHVVVQNAKHLPKVCSATVDTKSIAPNAYVLYQWYTQNIETQTIRGSQAPAWHHSRMCTLPVDVLQGLQPGKHPLKQILEFRVYHKVLQISNGEVKGGDLLIGTAKVDLSPLLHTGFEEICGWYHVVDFKGEGQGELKVQIKPSMPFPKKWATHDPGRFGKKLAFKKAGGSGPAQPALAINGPARDRHAGGLQVRSLVTHPFMPAASHSECREALSQVTIKQAARVAVPRLRPCKEEAQTRDARPVAPTPSQPKADTTVQPEPEFEPEKAPAPANVSVSDSGEPFRTVPSPRTTSAPAPEPAPEPALALEPAPEPTPEPTPEPVLTPQPPPVLSAADEPSCQVRIIPLQVASLMSLNSAWWVRMSAGGAQAG
eukprot:COSAG01_NODE_84_length_27672_cov_60.966344_13_plen_1169_part_00